MLGEIIIYKIFINHKTKTTYLSREVIGVVHEGFFLFLNIMLTTGLFFYVFKDKHLIGFQLGMNISMIAGGMLSISTGIILISLFPLQFTWITISTALLGMLTGAAFGALFDYQTVLTGWANGLMTGLMAPMVGAVMDGSDLFLWVIEISLFVGYGFIVVATKSP